jgi:hypothetical protein
MPALEDRMRPRIAMLVAVAGIRRTVAVARVGDGSAYAIPFALAAAGSAQYRTLVPGGPVNQRGVSSAVQVTANPSP